MISANPSWCSKRATSTAAPAQSPAAAYGCHAIIYLTAAGANDSHDDALAYLKAATRGMVAEARLLAYLEHAPRMVRYLEEKTCLRYRAMPNYSDYYPSLPGSKPGYRTMDPLPFNAALLGDEFAHMRPPQPGTLIAGRVTMTAGEAHVILCKERGWITALHAPHGALLARSPVALVAASATAGSRWVVRWSDRCAAR